MLIHTHTYSYILLHTYAGYQELPDKTKMIIDSEREKQNEINLEKIIGTVKSEDEKVNDILNHSKMRCGGCGSKIGSQTLTRAIARVQQLSLSSSKSPSSNSRTQLGGYRSEVVTGVGDDAALLRSPTDSSTLLVQTIDYFRSFISGTIYVLIYIFIHILKHIPIYILIHVLIHVLIHMLIYKYQIHIYLVKLQQIMLCRILTL